MSLNFFANKTDMLKNGFPQCVFMLHAFTLFTSHLYQMTQNQTEKTVFAGIMPPHMEMAL